MLTFLAIALKIAAVCVAIAIPAWLLQASCSVCGEESPSFGKAFLTGIVATIATGVFGLGYAFTIGLVLKLFVGSTIAGIGGALVSWIVTTTAYSAFLRIGMFKAARVAFVQHIFAVGIGLLIAAIGLPFFV